MASRLQMEGDDSVLLHVTHSNFKTFNADVRFSLQMSVEAVKDKLWKKCGTAVDSMSLELYDDAGSRLALLSDNSAPFGFYSPLNGYRLHIVDLDPSSITSGGWLDDTSLVQKYEISEEDYEKRQGTFRKFKEKLPHQNPTSTSAKVPHNYMENLCTNIKVGDRCQVQPGDKRGVVKYVGQAENLGPGFWVGIQYDEPLGKHDGMVRGTRYFDCPQLHGGIVRPDKVQVGDFPERDLFEEDEI
ncbi:tubulin-folding cofactor B [Silene latifolia]|uniref:tubulin-folding cofactor B n=1 Tax=Silene latifolia TaxID=37657 RepID=UPI003D777F6C